MTRGAAPPRSRVDTPAWLVQPQAPLRPGSRAGRRRVSFLERTLGDGAEVFRRAMYAEIDGSRGALQRFDPRAKLVALVALLVAVALVHSPLTLVVGYAAIVAVAWVGGVPMRSFVRRVWLVVPAFTAIAVAPATLSVVTPGQIVVPLWTWHGAPQGLTRQGLLAAALIVLRVACSVSLVLLVTLTTPWNRLLGALGALGVPRIFVTIIAMAYRYLFVLLGNITDLLMARKARTVRPPDHGAGDRRFVGAAVGTLLGKSHHLAEEVHQAMVARGYAGRHYALERSRFVAADVLVVLAALAAAVVILGADRVLR